MFVEDLKDAKVWKYKCGEAACDTLRRAASPGKLPFPDRGPSGMPIITTNDLERSVH